MQKWRLLICINFINQGTSSRERARQMSNTAKFQSLEWQTFEKPENKRQICICPPKPYCHTNKRQMYGSQSTQALLSFIILSYLQSSERLVVYDLRFHFQSGSRLQSQ